MRTPAPALLLLVAACATPPASPEQPATAAAKPATELAPFPYTAAQIRDANPPGSAYLFLLTNPDGTQDMELTRFVSNTDDVSTMHYRRWRVGAPVGELVKADAPWEDLKRHASFPAAQTTVTEARVRTPLGEIPAMQYAVARDGKTTTFTFHQQTSGAPWHMETTAADGSTHVDRVLVGRKDGETGLTWRIEVQPKELVELNYRLGADARLEGAFSGDGALSWDVHSHPAGEVVTHQHGDGQQGTFAFTPPAAGAYSVMWRNPGDAPVSILLQVSLQGEGALESTHPAWWH